MKNIILVQFLILLTSCNSIRQENVQGYWIIDSQEIFDTIEDPNDQKNIINFCNSNFNLIEINGDSLHYLDTYQEDILDHKFKIKSNKIIIENDDIILEYDPKRDRLFQTQLFEGCKIYYKRVNINNTKNTFDSVHFYRTGFTSQPIKIKYNGHQIHIIDPFIKSIDLNPKEKLQLDFAFDQLYQISFQEYDKYELGQYDYPTITIEYFKDEKMIKNQISKTNTDIVELEKFYPIITRIINKN